MKEYDKVVIISESFRQHLKFIVDNSLFVIDELIEKNLSDDDDAHDCAEFIVQELHELIDSVRDIVYRTENRLNKIGVIDKENKI